MCFSASASFIAGTTLCAVGAATLKRTEDRSERPFAMIPLLFGIQQLIEGVIWLTFRHDAPFEAAGAAVGLYLLYFLVTQPVVAEVAGRHIVYVSPHFYQVPMIVFYVAATCVSCFFSSHGFVRLFGVLALLSFVASYLVHVTALVSIWCFFAAILSLLIYLHLRFRNLGGFPWKLRDRRPSPAVS